MRSDQRPRLVLLGAGGFIGSNLVEHLCATDRYDVVGIDVTRAKLDRLDSLDGFTFLETDIGSPEALDACAEADVLVDLVAYATPSLYVTRPIEVFELNFTRNLEIVDFAVKHAKRLIQYSTCEVYGKPTGEVWSEDESDLVLGPVHRQRWIYASAKQLLERVIYAYGADDRLDYSMIRPFNFIGPRFDYLVAAGTMGGPRVFAHFMSALLTGGPMYLVDGGEQHRSFTHIADANRAFTTIVDSPDANRAIFNVGNPHNNTTIRNLAHRMQAIYGELSDTDGTRELVDVDGEEFYGDGYEDVDRVPADISKLQALGWQPEHDLDTALRDAMVSYIDSACEAHS